MKDHRTGTSKINTEENEEAQEGRKQTCLINKTPPETRKQPLPEGSDNGFERGDRGFAMIFLLEGESWDRKHQLDPESIRPEFKS